MLNSINILYIAVLIGGIIFIILGILQFIKARKAKNTWLSVPGVVEETSVITHRHHRAKGGTTTNYTPHITYHYQVKDQTYNGDQIGFGYSTYGKSKAEKIIAIYPQDAPITVFYDPADPSKAVLETKAKGGTTYILIGVFLVVIGYIAAFGLPG